MGKGARAGHGTAKARRAKDQARAAMLAGQGNPTARCPICGRLLAVGRGYETHITTHR